MWIFKLGFTKLGKFLAIIAFQVTSIFFVSLFISSQKSTKFFIAELETPQPILPYNFHTQYTLLFTTEGKVLEPNDSETETEPTPHGSKPEPEIDCDLQFNTHIKEMTKHVKNSQWIIPEDDVKSLKNNDKTGKCCWDVYTAMDR